jgi:hypothetical protein
LLRLATDILSQTGGACETKRPEPCIDPDEYGEKPKEYMVLERSPLLAQIEDSGYSVSALLVIVTDH